MAIINASVPLSASSNFCLLSSDNFIISCFSNSLEMTEFFLTICFILYPSFEASSTILKPVLPEAPVIAIFMFILFTDNIYDLGFFSYKFLFSIWI